MNYNKYILIVYFVLASTLSSLYSQNNIDKKVLLINSYHPQYIWTDEFTKGVENQLKNSLQQESLFIEYLDGRRMMDNKNYFETLVTFYKKKYSEIKFDAIITCDDYALEFLMKYKKDIFKNTPVIFGGVNDMSKVTKLDYTEYCGVFEGLPVIENLNLITQTQKNVTKIVILSDKTTQGIQVTAKAKELTKNWNNPKVKIEFNDDFSYEELKQTMSRSDENTAYYILVIIHDNKGRYFSYQKDLMPLSQISKSSIYGMWGGILIGSGILGGCINDPYSHGIEIATITKEIVNGKKPKDIKTKLQTVYKPRFDYNQLKKFNIDKKDLPKDAIIYFYPESYFEKHKEIIQVSLFTIVFLVLILIVLIMVNKRQKKHNQELNELSNELKQANDNLQQFSYMSSHQLRNSAINLQMLLDHFSNETIDENEKKWIWEKINNSNSTIKNIVDDVSNILAYQKHKCEDDFENVSIKQITDVLTQPLKELIENKKITIIRNFNDSASVFTHKDSLAKILEILINNAIAYQPIDRNLEINIDFQENTTTKKIIISDNGNDLPLSYKKNVFKLYHRGHKDNNGKGLGLFLAKQIGFSIFAKIDYIDDEEQSGAKFLIEFQNKKHEKDIIN